MASVTFLQTMENVSSTSPLVLGHRGFAAAEVENSLPAFVRAASASGVSGVELDVQLARDREVVVHHDRDLQRLAGDPRSIWECTAAELAETDLTAVRDNGDTFHAHGIPSLNTVLDTVPAPLLVDIELKSYEGMLPGLPDAVAAIVANRSVGDRVVVSSFDPRLIWGFRRAARDLGIAVATSVIYSPDPEVPWYLRRGLGMRLTGSEIAKPDWRSALRRRQRGGRSLVWTVNTREAVGEIERVRHAGACGIAGYIGDDPVAIRAWISEFAASADSSREERYDPSDQAPSRGLKRPPDRGT